MFTMYLDISVEAADAFIHLDGGDDRATLEKYAGENAAFHYSYILNTPFFSSSYGYWYTCMTEFRTVGPLDEQQWLCSGDTGCVGVVDSGTSLMIVPNKA